MVDIDNEDMEFINKTIGGDLLIKNFEVISVSAARRLQHKVAV